MKNEHRVICGTVEHRDLSEEFGGSSVLLVKNKDGAEDVLSADSLLDGVFSGTRVRITIEVLEEEAQEVPDAETLAKLAEGFEVLRRQEAAKGAEVPGLLLWSPGPGELSFRIADPRELAELPKARAVLPRSKLLFDNRFGEEEGRSPQAARALWADLGAALYGEEDSRVQALRAYSLRPEAGPTPAPQDGFWLRVEQLSSSRSVDRVDLDGGLVRNIPGPCTHTLSVRIPGTDAVFSLIAKDTGIFRVLSEVAAKHRNDVPQWLAGAQVPTEAAFKERVEEHAAACPCGGQFAASRGHFLFSCYAAGVTAALPTTDSEQMRRLEGQLRGAVTLT